MTEWKSIGGALGGSWSNDPDLVAFSETHISDDGLIERTRRMRNDGRQETEYTVSGLRPYQKFDSEEAAREFARSVS